MTVEIVESATNARVEPLIVVPFIGECHSCGGGIETGPLVPVVRGGYRFRYHPRCAERMAEFDAFAAEDR